MAYEALMRSDMEALRSPATIMKLAREQGALCEIERLTFFKSLENFDHLRSGALCAGTRCCSSTPLQASACPERTCEYMESRWHELCCQMVIEITEEEEIDHEALEAKRHVPASPACSRWTITAAALPTRTACWSFRPGSSRWISPSSAVSIPTRTSSRSCRTSWPMPTPRNMKIIAEGVETAAELRRSSSWARMRCRATFANLPPPGQNGTCRPQGHCRVQLCIRQRLNTNIKKSRRNAGLFASATGVLQFAADTGTGQTTAQEVLFIMVQVDLITGFLGAGKTTFLRRYVRYLVHRATMSAFWKTTSAQ